MTHPLVEISILHFKTSNCCLGLFGNFSYEAFNAKGYVFLFDLFGLLWVGNVGKVLVDGHHTMTLGEMELTQMFLLANYRIHIIEIHKRHAFHQPQTGAIKGCCR